MLSQAAGTDRRLCFVGMSLRHRGRPRLFREAEPEVEVAVARFEVVAEIGPQVSGASEVEGAAT